MTKAKKIIAVLVTVIAIFILTLGGLIGWVLHVRTTDIHAAAKEGSLLKVKILLAAKPELLNSKGDQNKTLLHSAADGHNKKMVEFFLKQWIRRKRQSPK